MIRAFTNLRLWFGSREILRGLTLDLTQGGITCLLGPSGCGKSTLLRLAAGLLHPNSGTVGLPASQTAMVFQEPRLLPWLTVAENLGLALPPALSGTTRLERIRQALHTVCLEGVERRMPRELSGGMAQRVGIARALLCAPSFLLMDEPFAALDAITRGQLQSMLTELIAARRCTCLFVTHDIQEALNIAHTLAVLQNGVIALAAPVPREAAAKEALRTTVLAWLQRPCSTPTPC